MNGFDQIESFAQHDALVARILTSEVHDQEALGIERELLWLIHADPPRMLIIDLSLVEFGSSALIGALVNTQRQLAQSAGQLKLKGVRGEVLEKLRMLNLDGTVFDICDSAAMENDAISVG